MQNMHFTKNESEIIVTHSYRGFSIIDISDKSKPIIYNTGPLFMGGDVDDTIIIN